MNHALVVGGTRFVGRHTVEDLLAHDYTITLCNRGESPNPFENHDGVDHVEADRTDEATLRAAVDGLDPDLVVDCVAYHPGEVELATDIFADATYVYVSSGSSYVGGDLPLREGDSALHDCTPEQATDDSPESYGPRKAEGDRVVARAAAERGVRAMAVRPGLVYGPHDYSGRLGYWIDRVAAAAGRRGEVGGNPTDDARILVPWAGHTLLHCVYVADVASAIRVVAEEGEAGAAYDCGDRNAATLRGLIERIADALDAEVEIVGASERELAAGGLEPTDFPLVTPEPFLMDTTPLADLGWESTEPGEAMAETVEARLEDEGDSTEDAAGRQPGPDPDAVDDLLDDLAG